MKELGEKMRCLPHEMRMDYADPLQTILLKPLTDDKPDLKGVIRAMDEYKLTRNNVMEQLYEVCLNPVEIPTKVKTAFTREYNKTHSSGMKGGSKRSSLVLGEGEEGEEGEEEEDEMEELEEGMEELEI
jgi:hypothetical protein